MQLKVTKLAALAFAALAPFCGHAGNPLPDGYRRIAYIESSVDGQQYITIPAKWYVYKQSLPNVITMVGEFTAKSTEYQNPCGFSTHGFDCLGIRRSDDPTPANQNKFGNDAFQSHSIAGGTQTGELAVPFNEQVTITWTCGSVNGNTSWQSLAVVTASGTTMSTMASQPLSADDWEKPLTLFAAPQPTSESNAGEVNSFSNFRLYGATVTLNGQLKADLVPVLNPSGVAGLWDNVTGQFLTTQGATPFVHPQPEQWFRFTLLKKNGSDAGLKVSELALYTADGENVASGLHWYEENGKVVTEQIARETPTGYFSFTGPSGAEANHQHKLFDGKFGTDTSHTEYGYCGNIAGETVNYSFTLHLDSSKGEVVKYNLMSGSDVNVHPNYALTEWTLERSYDGVNWEYVDEQRDRNTSGWTAQNNTWYRDGGTVQNANPGVIADHPPTNFYWLVKLPLPKLGQTVYSYTGAPISPKMMEESQFYTLGGVTNATNEGTYKLVCTPISGLTWANGSTGPYELEWQIVPESFLQRVANDPNRVDEETVDYDTGYASGGDIVLKIGNEYVHVFTNGTDRTFTAKTDLANARLLLVGGGGSGGSAFMAASGAGGGAGGMVAVDGYTLLADNFLVTVGSGGQRSSSRGNMGNPSLLKNGEGVEIKRALGGGGGGGSYYTSGVNLVGLPGGSGGGHGGTWETDQTGWNTPASGEPGQGYAGGANLLVNGDNAYINARLGSAGGGGAGGEGQGCREDSTWLNGGAGGIGRSSDILGWPTFFAGGGAGGSGGNAQFTYVPAVGGLGGGGSGLLRTDDSTADAGRLRYDGMNGLGGGGAGAITPAANVTISGGRGGDGIVIIRYQIPNTTLQATPPVANEGLVYNGMTQVGVPEGVGYTLKEAYYYATAVGTYTTTATLLPGYVWNDNGSTAPRDYEWTIKGLRISSVKLVANEAQWTGGDIIPQVASVTTVDGLTITDASVGWTVSYERNRVETDNLTDIGNVSVVVTGKGSLSGQARANFRIYDPKKIPLPKPSLAVYKYTGFAITPSFDPGWARDGYNTSGTLSATEKGTYTVTCTLKSGYQWENGSTMPYVVKWVIGDSFLERLASDGRKVAQSEATYATGGDVILHDADQGVYIHAFTNTAEAATFTANQALAGVEMLLVGGGGGGGYARGSRGGGGGAGGLVHIEGASLAAGSYGVTVGQGGAGGSQNEYSRGITAPSGENSAIRDFAGLAWLTAFGGGGGGGSAFADYSGHGAQGASGGCGGGNGGHCPVMTPAVGSQGGNGGVSGSDKSIGAGGGGAGGNGQSYTGSEKALNGGNGVECRILDTSEWFAGGGAGGQSQPHQAPTASGGKGGGGSTCLQQDRTKRDVLWTGEDGLGGGGAGSTGSTDNTELNGGRGGDGIVIIRYADPVNGLVAPVPVGKTLDYIGKTLVGVDELPGSTLSGDYYGDEEGDYTAIATLAPGYTKWADGLTALSREITWEIYVPSVVASAEDVEQEYDGTSHSITVTVTDPADATVTYSLTEDGEYTGTNPSFTEFGAYRVYWQATKDNYTGAKGSAVVRIGKKAAGEFVRLVITKRHGEGNNSDDVLQFSELALYGGDSGTDRIGSGLTLATGFAALKDNAGTCYLFPTNCYDAQNASKLFDNHYGDASKLCCPRNSTAADKTDARVEIYMHLTAADAAKVIRSYDLQSGDDVETDGRKVRSPTAWRLEVSSDCERWTIIDEKTADDTAENVAITQSGKWYGKDGSDNKLPYPIELKYAPLEVLETNPYAEDATAYLTVANYLQVVGFQLEGDDVVTARVRYNSRPHDTGALCWDTLFCQRDLGKKGSFALHRQFKKDANQGAEYNNPHLLFDYGSAGAHGGEVQLNGEERTFVVSASGVVTNDVQAVGPTGGSWTAAPNNSLLLFASDSSATRNGVPYQNSAYLKCYGFQVADSAAVGSPLRLDLMPASNTVTHAQGLYDRVSGSFYPLQAVADAGQSAFGSAQPQFLFSKSLQVTTSEDGWQELPVLREVTYGGTYLTSIPDYWQQEWIPSTVTGLGEYRQILRGQGPYAGEVTNVYTVGAAVTLDENGGTPGSKTSVTVLPGAMPALTGAQLPTKTGWMFAGYWSEQTGGTLYYNPDGTSAKDYPETDGPGTLYAHWLEGFEPLAKLNFDGTHYILTDYVPTAETWIETDLQTMGTKGSGGASLFGATEKRSNDSGTVETMTYGMNLSTGSTVVYGWVMGSEIEGASEQNGKCWTFNNSQNVLSAKRTVKFGNFGFTLSNGASAPLEGSNRPKWKMDDRFPCLTALAIGGYTGSLPVGASDKKPGYGTSVSPYSLTSDGFDVYSFKIYESENGSPDDAEQTLVRDYIPVTRTSDAVDGLYDIIGDKFYPLKTQTIVTLDPNGGNPLSTKYVYATAGEAMPSPIEIPTRPGYEFAGYTRDGWEIKKMTNQESDILTEGEKILATTAYGSLTINGVVFDSKLPGSGTSACGGKITFDSQIGANDGVNDDLPCCSTAYANLMKQTVRSGANIGGKWNLTFSGLEGGKSYLIQIVSHYDDRGSFWSNLGVKQGVYYKCASPDSMYGYSFVYRFVATGATETISLYFSSQYPKINAIQLRELSDGASGLKYYDENGTPVKDCDFGEGTTLYAQWDVAKYHVFDPEGPEIPVAYDWLTAAFVGEFDKDGYQAKLYETNSLTLMPNWASYMLGFTGEQVKGNQASTLIVLEQTADSGTHRLTYANFPAVNAVTNDTIRVDYTAQYREGAAGEWVTVQESGQDVIKNYPRFDVPVPTAEHPVRNYRILQHFHIGTEE